MSFLYFITRQLRFAIVYRLILLNSSVDFPLNFEFMGMIVDEDVEGVPEVKIGPK